MNKKTYRNVLAATFLTSAIVIPVSSVAFAEETASQTSTTPDLLVPEEMTSTVVEVLPTYKSASLGTFSDINSLAEAIIQSAKNFETTVSFSYTGNLSTIKNDMTAAINRQFVIAGNDYVHGTVASWKYSYTTAGDFTMTISYHATLEQENYVTQQVKSIAASLNQPGMTDLEKVLAVNEYIVTHTVYSKTASTTPHHAYAYLKEGKAVCQAYALLTYRLLTEMGMEARYVVGFAGEAHAWNSVKVDGEWYHLDTTWNDGSYNGYDMMSNVGYQYFLVTTETLRKDHSWDEADYPEATDNRYSYYHNMYHAIKHNGEIYYRDATDEMLYKLNPTTGGSEKLLNKRVLYLEANNESIYFSDYSNGAYLTAYNLITGETTVLDASEVSQLYILDGYLHYKVGKTAKKYELPLTETEQATRNVELKIAALSEFSNETLLQEARDAYTALTAEQQAAVKNLAKLVDLEGKYPANVAAANIVATEVAKFSTDSTRAELLSVIAKFDALTAPQQALVSNKSVVADFKGIISAQNVQIAAVEKQITSLKATSKTYLTDIANARTQVDALSQELQAEVKALSTLVTIETQVAAAQATFDLIEALDGSSVDAIIAARAAYTATPKAVQKYVTNLKTLTTHESKVKNVTAAVKAINAIDPTSSKFVAQVKTAKKAYDKTGTQKTLVSNADRFLAIEPQANVFELISKLKPTSAKYIAEVTTAKTAFDALSDTQYVTNAEKLATAVEAIKPAQAVVALIAALDGTSLKATTDARAAYDALDKQTKKYVTNLKNLTANEKIGKNALAAIKAIAAIDPTSSKFVAQVTLAEKAYATAGAQQNQVSNADLLLAMSPQADVFELIAKLKPTSAKYIAEVTKAKTAFDALSDTQYVTNAEKLATAVEAIKPAQAVVALIAALDGTSLKATTDARAAYDALDKQSKKYVTNLKNLTANEKIGKNALAAIKAITAIDPTSSKFVAQVTLAEKAYAKAGTQQNQVSNADLLLAMSPQADVFELIAKLKPTSAKYIAEVTTAKTAFDALSDTQYVTNAAKLATAVEAIKPAQAVVTEIVSVTSDITSGDTIEIIVNARASYEALDKASKKYVTNLKDLTTAEKKVAPALKVITAISDVNKLNVTTSTFFSKAAAMKKAYTALSAENKALVTNTDLYTKSVALYEIKNAQKTRKWVNVTVETFETLDITGVTADNFDAVVAQFNKLGAGKGTADIAEIQGNVTLFVTE